MVNKEYICTKTGSKKYYLTEKGQDVLKDCLEKGQSFVQISKKFNINPNTLSALSKRYGIYKDNRRKYTLNENYFDKIESKEQAYWLGFLAADGYIDQKRGVINIALQKQDKEHIQRFLQVINSNKQIKEHHSFFNGKDHITYEVTINSVKMTKQLRKYGLYANKSLTLQRPYSENIPRAWIKYWILGYFDGDGCLSIWQDKTRNNKYCYKMGFLGTKDVIDFIQDFFQTNKTVSLAHNCENTYQFYYTESLTRMCLDYLYSEPEVLEFCLKRKYNKYLKYIR